MNEGSVGTLEPKINRSDKLGPGPAYALGAVIDVGTRLVTESNAHTLVQTISNNNKKLHIPSVKSWM